MAPDQSHWQKDEFILVCNSCQTKFSLSVRRHHCRCCGQIFCGSCVEKSIPLPSLGYPKNTPQRVCESCYTTVSLGAKEGDDEPVSPEIKIQRETIEGLKRLYRAGIKPLEIQFKFGDFYSPILSDADFDAKPMVLLIGQYSVGKTSFIRFLVGRDFPGQRVGPEPTTDRFVIVEGTKDANAGDSTIPGNALAVQSDKPYKSLQRFGAAFLDKLECAVTNTRSHGQTAEILDSITFVDTPGILSGEKQRIGRSYDYTGVVEWFAGRCDRILLLFDAHKLDISDEFQAAIGALRGHDEKIRVVLNKADSVDAQQLMRVHGALMWALGKIIRTPEVVRVYVGSFWDQPLQNVSFKDLFERESRDLITDLKSLPNSAITRRVNEVVKRARAAKTHALIIEHLRTKLPYFGREKALNQMLDNLEEEYRAIHRKYGVPLGDFPRPETFRKALKTQADNDLTQFPPLNQRILVELNEILSSYLPRLHARHTNLTNKAKSAAKSNNNNNNTLAIDENPFLIDPSLKLQDVKISATGGNDDKDGDRWVIEPDLFSTYVSEFKQLGPKNGKLSGEQLRDVLMSCGVPKPQLKRIWDLADIDGDGYLDQYEYAICKHLINVYGTAGQPIPDLLPPNWVPKEKKLS